MTISFKKICFNLPECIAKMTSGVPNKKLRPSITGDSVWKPLPEGVDEETWAIPPVKPSSLLEDGDIIDMALIFSLVPPKYQVKGIKDCLHLIVYEN